jgi:hypothetical protein
MIQRTSSKILFLTPQARQRVKEVSNARLKTGWTAINKTDCWGIGKGPNKKGLDAATVQGVKGEQAVCHYLNTSCGNMERTHTPDHYDLLTQTNFKKVEIKTATDGYDAFLLKVQAWNYATSKFEYLYQEKDYNSILGMNADYYIFCTADPEINDWQVKIVGWITRQEILDNYAHLSASKRRNDQRQVLWQNYEIPRAALHDMNDFIDIFLND